MPYWLFLYEFYYPNGGLDDFVGRFETAEEAMLHPDVPNADGGSVVNVETGEYREFQREKRGDPTPWTPWRRLFK